MSDFKREERYLVLKLKHMTSSERIALQDIVLNSMGFAIHQKPCVVVESDWPIYEQTWDAVQRLAENKPQKIEDLEQQLAESQASNERLREFVAGVSNASTYASDYTGDVEYIDKDYKEDAMDLLRETPKQSLDHIKAEAGYKKYGEEVSEEQIAKVLADQWYFTTESKDKLVRPLMKHFHVFQREE